MTSPNPAHEVTWGGDEASLLTFTNFLLRSRRTILAVGGLGALVGLLAGLLRPRQYVAEATFMPQASVDASLSSLALAASQFGLRLPTQGGGWGPAVYVEVLDSRALLEPLTLDTVIIPEEGGRRVALMDLLKVRSPKPEQRVERGVRALRRIIRARELKALNAVQVTVTTRWPSVSQTIAQQLVSGVNKFNLETRQTQASAERRFVEARADDAELTLRQAEDRLQGFLQRNRTIAGSPELEFQRDRLQRDVNLWQQLYSALLQSREEARVREVRDTPVITILEDPRLPRLPAPRMALLKTVLGALGGGILGFVIAWLSQGFRNPRDAANVEAREFLELIAQMSPAFLRRRKS
jgi:uncharacterized protein involved in exopolysaccharide biosynthesis